MLKEFSADLHIHTCLSPCGGNEMKPAAIVKTAKEKMLDIIGITDHNSSENVLSVKRCGEKEGLKVLGGFEITTREEVHILGLFDRDEAIMALQRIIYDNLSGENDEDSFGEQLIADEFDRVTSRNKRLLIGAVSIALEDIVKMIHASGGVAIASHIDREGFGLIGQLGFIPEGLAVDALEVSQQLLVHSSQFTGYGLPLVSFSDAHYLEDIGESRTKFVMEAASIPEVRKALLNECGRRISVE